MIKEKIGRKINEYKQQQQQLRNNILAYDGAIQALEQLLKEINKESKEDPDGR